MGSSNTWLYNIMHVQSFSSLTHDGVFALVNQSCVHFCQWLVIGLLNGREIYSVFFDYHETFNSVPHLPLLENLHFNSSILEWIILPDALKMWWSMANLLALPLSSLEYHNCWTVLLACFILISTQIPEFDKGGMVWQEVRKDGSDSNTRSIRKWQLSQ